MELWIRNRNKKVACSRWKKIHNKEEGYIRKNHIGYLKARIFGYIAGDGNISVRESKKGKIHHVLKFFPDHESLIKIFNDAFIKVYNKKPIIKKKKCFYDLRIYSKPIILDMLSYAKFGMYNWDIPKFVTDNKSKKEWIRAFFDAEAYVGPQHIKVHSVNKEGLLKIQSMLLDDFKIESKIYSYTPKNPKHNIQYILMIIQNSMRRKFLNKIGFNHKVKKNKLLKYLI